MFATNFADTVARATVGILGTTLCAGVCLLGATAPAKAAEAPKVTTVSYSDLNVASSKGKAALDQRIRQAARTVCETGRNDVAAHVAEIQCVRDAIEAAQAQVNG